MFSGAHPAVLVTSFLSALFLLALVAVILSKQANTTSVIQQAGTSLTDLIKAAVSPVTMGGSQTQ